MEKIVAMVLLVGCAAAVVDTVVGADYGGQLGFPLTRILHWVLLGSIVIAFALLLHNIWRNRSRPRVAIDDAGGREFSSKAWITSDWIDRDAVACQESDSTSIQTNLELRRIIDTIPGMTWCADKYGEPLYLNRRLVEFTGNSLQDFRAGGWMRLVHPDDLAYVTQAWQLSVNTGGEYRCTNRYRKFDGSYHWFEERANAFLDEEGRVAFWYGIVLDIDKTKRIEDALRHAQATLARASRIAAAGEMSASIAHEIRQPLAAVIANAQATLRWLETSPPNLERVRASTQRIIQNGNDADSVVQRIRSIFKHIDPERKPLGINELIREVMLMLNDDLRRKGIGVFEDFDESLPPVIADRGCVHQILVNLVQNAVESMDGITNREKIVRVRTRLQDPTTVTIQIQDRGCGISNQDMVFEPFFTTKANGLGVGLSICKSMVNVHGGRLWALANDDGGSTFVFTLPAHGSVA